MRAVVLAAGDGGRLGPHTDGVPKPLVPLHGRPLVDYTLEALAAAGASEAVIVTGYREGQLVAALAASPPPLPLRFVSNPHFDAGASLSLRAARPFAGDEPFLLVMSDHLLSAPLLHRLVQAARHPLRPRGLSLVAADFAPHEARYADEATKLAVAVDGRVTAIGKRLPAWDALDTGAFWFEPRAWAAVDKAPEGCELSSIFAGLARRRALGVADVSGAFWYDVDTAEDLEAAAGLLPCPALPRTA